MLLSTFPKDNAILLLPLFADAASYKVHCGTLKPSTRNLRSENGSRTGDLLPKKHRRRAPREITEVVCDMGEGQPSAAAAERHGEDREGARGLRRTANKQGSKPIRERGGEEV